MGDDHSTTTTVPFDEQGRLTIPKPLREALDIEGVSGLAELRIEIKERDTNE